MQDNANAIPEDFDMADLAQHLTETEVEAIKAEVANPAAEGGDPAQVQADPPPAAAPPAEPTQPAQPPAAAAQPEPQMVNIPDTTEAEAQLKKLEGDMKSLMDRYDDGELSRDEFMTQQTAMMRQAATAQAQIDNAAHITTTVKEQQLAQWDRELDAFHGANAEVAQMLMSPAMVNDWDAALRAITGSPNYAHLPPANKIELAYDMLSASLKATTGKPLPAIAGKAAPAPSAAQTTPAGPRNDPRPDAIQTLAGLNAADDRMVSDGQFAAIDKMMERDPLQAERMIEALPPERLQAYMEQVGR